MQRKTKKLQRPLLIGGGLLLIISLAGLWQYNVRQNAPRAASNQIGQKENQTKLVGLRTAAQKNPSDLDARKAYAAALYATGDAKAAAVEYEAAVAIIDKDPELYDNLGNAYRDAHSYQRATAAYHHASQLNPQLVSPYFNLATMQLSQKDTAGAVLAYQSALAAVPNNQQILLALASAYQKNHDTAAARQTYQTILQLNPNSSIAKSRLQALQ